MDPSRSLSHPIDIPAIAEESDEGDQKTPPQDLASSIRDKLQNFFPSISIFRVPDEIASGNQSLFVPVRVSIGPLHHGSSHLKSMEDHKWRYLGAFLDHNQSLKLEDLLDLIRDRESRARKCYAVEVEFDTERFTRMMLLDCCFVLELLLRFSAKSLRWRNDPIFTAPGLLFDLKCDMILLENQVPFFLLKDIFDGAQIQQLQNFSLNELAFRFFGNMIAGERQFVQGRFIQESDHLLAMVHYAFLSSSPRIGPKHAGESPAIISASALQKKGIKLKEARNPRSLLDIEFQDGVLQIPPLKVHQRTETILCNLIAYERCQFGTPWQVEAYVYLMGHLLQSDEDVKLLRRRKILMDNEDDVTKVIRDLNWMKQQKSKFSGAYFAGVFVKLDEGQNICCGLWHRLKRRGAGGIAIRVVAFVVFAAAFGSVIGFLIRRYK